VTVDFDDFEPESSLSLMFLGVVEDKTWSGGNFFL